MMRCVAAGLMLSIATTASAGQAAPADRLAPVRALVGRWQGTSEGVPGKATVEREYTERFGSRFIHGRNRSTYPPQEKNPKGEVHENFDVFSADTRRGRIVLRQFHTEGFVNQYVRDRDGTASRAVFTSEAIENIAPGWRARETYVFAGADAFEEIFELAAPGKDFEVYSHARFTRVPAGAGADLTAALQPLAFLLGDWTAAPGAAGETGAFSFTREAQGQIVVRKNYAEYPASAGKPASRHDDLMVMSVDGGAVRADYYDNEGHVIHYTVTAPKPREALFESDAISGEPRYRLRYTPGDDGVLSGEFAVAPPATPHLFTTYLTWTARRRQ